mgnify:CR=1 FL=1
MESRETIAAIATGMGNAGIGIVRISGDAAIRFLKERTREN